MTDYTPRLSHVRAGYVATVRGGVGLDEAEAQFRRWLETVRAEAKAEAWDECDDAWDVAHSLDHIEPWAHLKDNPYK